MSKELFGNNISPDCAYCDRFDSETGCKAGKSIKNGRCRKFTYNPTLRKPKGEAALRQFSKEDFEI